MPACLGTSGSVRCQQQAPTWLNGSPARSTPSARRPTSSRRRGRRRPAPRRGRSRHRVRRTAGTRSPRRAASAAGSAASAPRVPHSRMVGPGHAEPDEERADRQRVVPGLLAEGDLLGVGQALAAVLGGPGDPGEPGVVQLGLEGPLAATAGPAAGLVLGVVAAGAARGVGRQPRPGAGAELLGGFPCWRVSGHVRSSLPGRWLGQPHPPQARTARRGKN